MADSSSNWTCRSRVFGLSAALGLLTLPSSAFGQTWTGGDTTPDLLDIAAVDETGEIGWIFGAEDLAGDGLDTFQQQEQSIDVRTAYAAADSSRFWVRAYVSNSSSPGGNMTLYVFVDADENESTGGSAAATEIDDRFDSDPTSGGYDYVVAVGGNEMIEGVWEYDESADEFVPLADPETLALAEVGTDVDPIQIGGGQHGYLQFDIDLSAVALTMSCNADLFIRSLNDTGALGTGDLEVGGRTQCGGGDGNGNDVPDALEPTDECTDDDQCPRDGICIEGSCAFPIYCRENDDCRPDEVCDAAGYCRADPTGSESCSDNSDCNRLICSTSDVCEACTSDSQCSSGFRCSVSGYCIDSSDTTPPMGGDGDGDGDTASDDPEDVLGPGEEIQGGAFKCAMTIGRARVDLFFALFVSFLFLVSSALRRVRRSEAAD